ncbi:hypothetical protein [Pseudoalteromonas sp. S16_S37]|uniref:hypothetical protein n=1 Tax=Pseudoalteromonas sp. S16_S37 TaxID=2720228 RepID=UPI001EED4359|nr:hypothetical protein [Pseudoalteromonas sp. S16_S37]
MKYLLLLFSLICLPSHSETYHFASINYLIEQEVGRIVISEIYQQLGIDIIITPLPKKMSPTRRCNWSR